MTVWNGSAAVCTHQVASDGMWSCMTDALPAGTDALTATQADGSYGDDSNFAASRSAAKSIKVT